MASDDIQITGENNWVMPRTTVTMQTAAIGAPAPWNGPICTVCGSPYAGIHTCSVEQLMEAAERAEERAADLRRRARERFEAMKPVQVRGPRQPYDTSGCPCRPENGGSGVCGCTLGGPQITV